MPVLGHSCSTGITFATAWRRQRSSGLSFMSQFLEGTG